MNSEFFEKLNDWIRNTETSIVNFLSTFAPWLAPIIPAYMTFQHAGNTLKFPPAVAFTAALLVEILGFSIVSTYFSFWFYNRRNRAESKKAPIFLIFIVFTFYLALILTTNVLLDAFPGSKWAEVVVRALFTLQTMPAAVLVSVRAQHRELLSEIAKEKKELSERPRKSSETSQGENDEVSESFGNLPKDWRKVRPLMSLDDVRTIANMNADQLKEFAKRNDLDIRTASNWRTYANQEVGKNV